MIRPIVLLLVLLPTVMVAQAPVFRLSPNIVAAYIHLTEFNTEAAEEQLMFDARIYPINPMADYLRNTLGFYQFLISDSPILYRKLLAKRQTTNNHLEAGDPSSPFYHFTLSEFHLQWAIMRLKAGEEVQAARELRKAFKHWELNQKLHPAFSLNLKPAAMLHAMGAAIPANYKWLSDMAGISGTGKQALNEIQELEKVIHQEKTFEFLLPEVSLIRYFIEANLLSESTLTLPKISTTNNLHLLSKALVHFKRKEMQLAAECFQTIIGQANKQTPPMVFYFMGECKLNESFSDEGSFGNFLRQTQGNSYLKAAWRKKGWIAFLRKDTAEYRRCMQVIPGLGSLQTDDDRQAQLEALSNRLPNEALLRARVLHDGGQYASSNRVISDKQLKIRDVYDAAEFWYRMGRNCQGLGELDQAFNYLRKAIDAGKNLPEYFAASAALQCGAILEQQKRSEASKYYRMVDDFPDHPYKKSLDAKAEASLKRLKTGN